MFVTYVKLWGAALSLVVVMLLSGCPSVPPVEKQSPKPADTTVSPGIDTATYHVVKGGETLYSIAQSYGRDYRDIAQWNNISVDDALSPGQSLRIDGPGAGYQPGMSSVPVVTPVSPAPTYIPEAQSAEGTHIVQPGENLYAIARQYGHNFKTMAAWNHIEPPYHLRVGQVLVVSPPPGGELTPTSPVIPQYTPQPQVVTPQHAPKSRVVPTDKGYHVVQPGDTLFGIARHYGLSVGNIASWNGFQPPYPPLSLGQKLRVSPPEGGSVVPTPYSPPPRTVKPSSVRPQSNSSSHIVVPGDTLYGIARHYGISFADLVKWNGLQKPYLLSLGQELRVVPPTTSMRKPGSTQESGYLQPVGLRPRYHIVKRGESLEGIAIKYGLPINDLAKRNGIGRPYSVYPGLKLTIAPR